MERKEAAAQGLVKYETGRPCKHGHLSPRYTATGVCVTCSATAVARHNKALRQSMNAVRFGYAPGARQAFTFDLHPDDHAAALAYCQALALQRGTAQVGAAIEATRAALLPIPPTPRLPSP